MEITTKAIFDVTIVTVSTALLLAPRVIDAYLAWRGRKNAPEDAK